MDIMAPNQDMPDTSHTTGSETVAHGLPHLEAARNLCGPLAGSCSRELLDMIALAWEMREGMASMPHLPQDVILAASILHGVRLLTVNMEWFGNRTRDYGTDIVPGMEAWLPKALALAAMEGRDTIQPRDLLVVMVRDPGTAFGKYLIGSSWVMGGMDLGVVTRTREYWVARIASQEPTQYAVTLGGLGGRFDGQPGMGTMPPPLPPPTVSPPHADDVWRHMHGMFPWMDGATEFLAGSWALMVAGKESRIPPMLLDGASGVGKTRWCMEAARFLGMHHMLFTVGGAVSGAAVSGFEKSWKDSEASLVSRVLREAAGRRATIIVDDLDKGCSSGSSAGPVHEALLPLLEESTARTYRDVHSGQVLDASGISWFMTCNGMSGLGSPFLTRVDTFHVPRPTQAQVQVTMDMMLDQAGRTAGTRETDLVALTRAHGSDGDLRAVRRALDGLRRADAWRRPAPQGRPVLTVVPPRTNET